MQRSLISDLIARVRRVQEELPDTFSTLSEEQFNWKPSAKAWSIGQCVDHMITTNAVYFPVLELAIKGEGPRNFWSRVPFWPSFVGWMMLSSVGPEPKRKVKTVPVFKPSQSAIPKTRLEDFKANCERLIQYYEGLRTADFDRTIVISPASSIITFKLKDILTLLANHEERHFIQAKNVLALPAFPNEVTT